MTILVCPSGTAADLLRITPESNSFIYPWDNLQFPQDILVALQDFCFNTWNFTILKENQLFKVEYFLANLYFEKII